VSSILAVRLRLNFPKIGVHGKVELHAQYMLSPLSPLITRPDEAYDLDLGALKRNLLAHAAHDKMIRITGDKLTLCLRLVELLERRRDDLAVRVMALRRWDQGLGDNRK
jgi:hypothetical protein